MHVFCRLKLAQKQLADAQRGLDPASMRIVEEMIEGALHKVAPSRDSYEGKDLIAKCEDLVAALDEIGKLVDTALDSVSTPDTRDSKDWRSRSLARKVQLMANLCSTLEDRRSSSSIAGEQMLRKILQIQLVLAELLETEEEISPVEMAQRVALLFRDKEEVIDDIDDLVVDTLNMTEDERPLKPVVNKVRELAMAYEHRVDRPQCTVATQTGEDTWLERIVRTGTLFLLSGASVQPTTAFTKIPTWAEDVLAVASSPIHQPPNSPRLTGRSAKRVGDMLSPRVITPRGRFSPRVADDPKRSSIRSKSTSPTRYESLTSAWSSGHQSTPGEKVKPYKPASPEDPDTLPAESAPMESDASPQTPNVANGSPSSRPVSYKSRNSGSRSSADRNSGGSSGGHGRSAVPPLNFENSRLDRCVLARLCVSAP